MRKAVTGTDGEARGYQQLAGNGPQGDDRVAGLRGWPSHMGLRPRPRLLREAAVGICAMAARLTQRRRVWDDGFGL